MERLECEEIASWIWKTEWRVEGFILLKAVEAAQIKIAECRWGSLEMIWYEDVSFRY